LRLSAFANFEEFESICGLPLNTPYTQLFAKIN